MDKQQEEEEKRIKALMKGMASAGSEDVCEYLWNPCLYNYNVLHFFLRPCPVQL